MWPEQEKTEELLEQAKQGDDDAINALIDRHRNALRHLVRMRLDRKIQRRVDVSDVVQDVLVEANRRLKNYLDNPAMPFHLWIRHIARDSIIDAHRILSPVSFFHCSCNRTDPGRDGLEWFRVVRRRIHGRQEQYGRR